MAPDSTLIKKMTLAEKIEWMEALWDSIREHSDQLPTPESHLKIVRQRLKEIDEGSADLKDAHEFLDELEREFQ